MERIQSLKILMLGHLHLGPRFQRLSLLTFAFNDAECIFRWLHYVTFIFSAAILLLYGTCGHILNTRFTTGDVYKTVSLSWVNQAFTSQNRLHIILSFRNGVLQQALRFSVPRSRVCVFFNGSCYSHPLEACYTRHGEEFRTWCQYRGFSSDLDLWCTWLLIVTICISLIILSADLRNRNWPSVVEACSA